MQILICFSNVKGIGGPGHVEPVAGRNFRPFTANGRAGLMSADHVVSMLSNLMSADGSAVEQLPVNQGGDIDLSMSIHPEIVDDGEVTAELAKVADRAMEMSGLSFEAWSALPDQARDMLMFVAFKGIGGSDISVPCLPGDGDEPTVEIPDDAAFVFDPEKHGHKYRGKNGGYWIIDGDGENVIRITQDAYKRTKDSKIVVAFVQDDLEPLPDAPGEGSAEPAKTGEDGNLETGEEGKSDDATSSDETSEGSDGSGDDGNDTPDTNPSEPNTAGDGESGEQATG